MVQSFDGDTRFSFAPAHANEGLRHPAGDDALLDLIPVLFRQYPWSSWYRLSPLRELLGVDCNVVSVHIGVVFISLLTVYLLTFIRFTMSIIDISFLRHTENVLFLLPDNMVIIFNKSTQK